MNLELRPLSSREISDHLEELAHLRIEVFREFPYLYDGGFEYEKNYLRRYMDSKDSLVVLAIDEGNVVGATTCLPMSEEEGEFRTPLDTTELNPEKTFYFGESIILPKYRGHGIGHQFFAEREKHAREVMSDLEHTCFCAVDRRGHRLTPENYRPLDEFWNRMGYFKRENMRASFAWKDIDKDEEDHKDLYYWVKKWK